MTRNSVNLYAISDETLFYSYKFYGVFLQFGRKKYISEFWKIISSFQKYSWLLFTPIILITKYRRHVWRDVNMRTSNSPLRHIYVLSTRTYPTRSKRTTSSTRITMWSHLKFYGRLWLIRSVWRASKYSVFKIDWNCNFVGLLHHRFWFQLVLTLFGYTFQFFKLPIWLRFTDEGSVPEMRIWSMPLI